MKFIKKNFCSIVITVEELSIKRFDFCQIFWTGSSEASEPKIESALRNENTNIWEPERTFYDLLFLSYHGSGIQTDRKN